jgi:hypothetical protein
MIVEVNREAGAVVCVIDDVTYSFRGRNRIPAITQYGFFGTGADLNSATTSIFRKITLKRG